jgi:RNA polymerase sigma-70 factor (ECF subfamily)
MSRSNKAWLTHLRAEGPEQRAALGDLRRALLRGLRKALSSYSRADDAFLEDAVQDSLLRILDRLALFEGRSQFVTWATTIAIRTAMSELRRHRWKDVSLDDLVESARRGSVRIPGESSEPAVRSERRALVGKMYEVIEQELTDRQRTALLAELKGMPQQEIARHLDSNRNAVYKLTHDARKRLKRGLEAAGYHADHIQAAFTA